MKNKKPTSADIDGYDLFRNLIIAHDRYVSRARLSRGRNITGTKEHADLLKARKALMKALGKYGEYIESLTPEPF